MINHQFSRYSFKKLAFVTKIYFRQTALSILVAHVISHELVMHHSNF